jgi:hypothetical protein
MEPIRFSYIEHQPGCGPASLSPLLPLTLEHSGERAEVRGLVDSGASVNVLPYSYGLQLGLVWEQQTTAVVLSGNLSQLPARAVVVIGALQPFEPVRRAFAWTRAENIPLILGQTNFFMEFDVCFFRSRGVFDVSRRGDR